ncbi:hypothetical protein HpKG64_15180 [Helicobacter pylori]
MHIGKVKTAFKIADVEYVKDSTKLNFNYLKDLKGETRMGKNRLERGDNNHVKQSHELLIIKE